MCWLEHVQMEQRRSPSSVSGTTVYQGLGKPDTKGRFRPGPVKEIIREVLAKLKETKYDHDTSGTLVKQLSTEIRDRTRQLGFQRYKVMVHVVVGAFKGQGIRVANRCFWDTETDDVATESFKNVSEYLPPCLLLGYALLRSYSLWRLPLLAELDIYLCSKRGICRDLGCHWYLDRKPSRKPP
jgi:hypothetical protein